MKKNICIILIIVTFYLLTGCSKDLPSKIKVPEKTDISETKDNSQTKDNNTKDTSDTAKIGDYYPFEKNIKYMYVGDGNEYATYSIYVDYLRGNRQQIRVRQWWYRDGKST